MSILSSIHNLLMFVEHRKLTNIQTYYYNSRRGLDKDISSSFMIFLFILEKYRWENETTDTYNFKILEMFLHDFDMVEQVFCLTWVS